MLAIRCLALVAVLLAGCTKGILTDGISVDTPSLTPGYPGAATFPEPSGFDNFVTLGADPTGQVNAEPILRAWFDAGGSSLYIPAGTYKLTYTTETKRGLITTRNLRIVGAGEDLVTITMGPDDTSFSISLIEIQGACDVTIQGAKIIGPTMTGPIPYEQVTTSLIFGNTVVSSTPTNVRVDHVKWDKFVSPFIFFGGATTPTTLMITNFEGRGYGGIGFYRDYSENHQLILRLGSFLKWGIPAAQNPYFHRPVGVACYVHGNINFRVEGIYFNNSENPTIHGQSFKCGGGQDRLRTVKQQVMVDCLLDSMAGPMTFDGWVRTTILRCRILNANDGTTIVLGGMGQDFVDCELDTTGMLCGGNKTYNFIDCSFRKCGIRVAEEGIVVNIKGGATHWGAGDSAPGYLVRCDQNTTSVINIEDHDFWSEITENGGNTYILYAQGGTWNVSRTVFRGKWRNGADAAPVQVLDSDNVQQVILNECKFDIGTRWAANVEGRRGRTTLLTRGTSWGGAKVNDPHGKWTGS